MPKVDDKTLETLLVNSEFINIPEDFEVRVLNALEDLPEVVQSEPTQPHKLTWLALISGSLISIMQISAFIFSVWQLNSAA